MDRRLLRCSIGMVIVLAWVSVTLAETVSEEAQRYMARGFAAVEMAKTPKDYERAVREFEQAAKLAPNWPDVYFNLGSVQAKAGNYIESTRNYKRYLDLAPKAPDSAKVRQEIYKLEYRAEEEKAKEVKRDGRFIAYDDNTVLDTRTNLKWAAKDNGSGVNWQDARKYCENYRGGGHTDWRMPTQDELAGLYDKAKTYKSECGYDVHLTELISLTSNAPWASETYGASGGAFEFTVGGKGMAPRSRVTNGRALPVRSVKVKIGDRQSMVPDSEKTSVPIPPTGAYKGVRTYENGDKYEGEFSGRKFYGKGTYTYTNGDKYAGEFVDGKFTSKGIFTCNNGKQFTGNLQGKEPLRLTITCD
ncbi:MAG: Lcl domain-containing protein [Syntrophorhabdaceae bacterium]